jgi:protein SCO1
MRYAAWFLAGIWGALWFGLNQVNASSKLLAQRDASGRLLSAYTVDAKTKLQMQGRLVSYWPNGHIRTQADFDKGVYVGEYLEWHSNGIPAKRLQYALGREHGVQRGWRADGGVDFSYEMRGGQRFGVPGTMPCVVDKGDRKVALARYLKESGQLSARANGDVVERLKAPELPMFNDASLLPKWVVDGTLQEHAVSDFKLQDHRAERFEPAQLVGRPAIVSFFFTGCSSLCPTTIAQMKALEARLQKLHANSVQFIGVTVTPLQDDVPALASYAKRFDLGDAWRLVTGDVQSIEGFAQHSFFAKTTADVHTERAFLLDADKRIRGVYNATQPADMARLTQDAIILSRAI